MDFKFCNKVHPVLVEVEQGHLRGEILPRTTGNGTYVSFKGIPYAASPIGELRFMAPQPPLSWTGVRNATEHGSICNQIDINTGEYADGDEDCLFLNVYTPTVEPEVPMPVMIFIHGGNYLTGSGNDDTYGPDFLINYDVILVTLNYRLGVMGFLAMDTKEVPGNAGLKDQVAAMQWVRKNIARFGGDPDNVTIFGQSAGSSSVTFHVVSPLSKGLFKRAIGMSGVFLREISLPLDHKRRALLLSQKLGLYTSNSTAALKHLQNVSVESLVTAKPFLLYTEKPRKDVLEFTYFLPIVEKNFGSQNFLTEDPLRLLVDGTTNVDTMMLGHTALEGIYKGITQKEYILEYFPDHEEFLVPLRIANVRSSSKVLELSKPIKKHYFGDKKISEETVKEIINFYTYATYVYNIYRYLEIWIKSGKKAYFYQFTCFSERNIYGKYGLKYGLKNATHSDDLSYLFDGKKLNLTVKEDSDSYKMIIQTSTLYTNFAKYGNPTPDNSTPIWLDYSQNKSYMDIGYELTPKTADNNENLPHIDFWRSIYERADLFFS